MALNGNEPISAANLKSVVDQLNAEIESGGGVLLYEGIGGSGASFVTTKTLSLSRSAAEFSYLEVYAQFHTGGGVSGKTNGWVEQCGKFAEPDGRTCCMLGPVGESQSPTGAPIDQNTILCINFDAKTVTAQTTNVKFVILRVIGYK